MGLNLTDCSINPLDTISIYINVTESTLNPEDFRSIKR